MTAIRDITKAQRARIEQMLDKPVRLSNGQVVSRRVWIDGLRAQGGVVKVIHERKYDQVDKVKDKIERMGRNVPWGNPNHPDTIRFNDEKARLLASLDGERTIVSLPDGRFHELNKSKLEYFQSAPAAPPGTTVG